MMFTDNKKISSRQVWCIIFSYFSGVLVVYVPFVVLKGTVEGGITSAVLSFAVASVFYIFAARLCIKAEKRKNKIAKKAVYILIFLKNILLGGACIKLFANIIFELFLENININMIGLILVLSSAYLSIKGIESCGRFAEITSFFILVLGALAVVLVLADCELWEIKTGIGYGKEMFYKTRLVIMPLLTGEIFIFIIPDINNKRYAAKKAFKAMAITGVFIILLLSVALCRFGEFGIADKTVSVLQMMNSINFSASILERQDVIFMGMWLAGIFAFAAYTIYFQSVCVKNIFSASHKNSVAISAGVLFGASLFFGTTVQILNNLNFIYVLNGVCFVFTMIYIFVWGGE